MIRTGILLAMLGVGVAALSRGALMMWPLRAAVTDLRGRPVAFRAVTLGGDLIVQVEQRARPGTVGQSIPEAEYLRPGDTLRATTPATYPLDLAHGPVVFFTRGRDSIRIAVRRFPFDGLFSVTGEGRRLTIRRSNTGATIDAK